MRGLLPAAVIMGAVGGAHADVAIWLECRPALDRYCANIHIGCAGRSNLETEPFTLAFAEEGMLHRADAVPLPLVITWSGDAAVFRPIGSRDWIRVETGHNDRYPFSQRIYRDGKALMTRGICQPAPADISLPRVLE